MQCRILNRLMDVKGPCAAAILHCPVVETVCGVARGLDLGDEHTGTEGMNRTRRKVMEVPGTYRDSIEKGDDPAAAGPPGRRSTAGREPAPG